MSINRRDGLDAARGSLMLFGVVLHILLFSKSLIDVDSEIEQQVLRGLYFTGHAFRLPAFFVIAGYFAVLIIEKRGPREYLRNRGRRLGLVLLFISPLLVFLTMWASGKIVKVQSFADLVDKGFLHLWFIYYLLIFSVVTYLFTFVKIPERLSTVLARAGVWMSNPTFLWGAPMILMAAPTVLTPTSLIRTSTSFIPDLALLGFYGLFFVLGVLLYRAGQDGLDALEKRAFLLTVIGFTAAQVAFGWGTNVSTGPFREFFTVVASFYLALGVIGLFVRFGKPAGHVSRYLTRTSYWVYLVHPPFVWFLLRAFADVPISPSVTMAIVFIVSVALSLASFELLVRRTPLARVV